MDETRPVQPRRLIGKHRFRHPEPFETRGVKGAPMVSGNVPDIPGGAVQALQAPMPAEISDTEVTGQLTKFLDRGERFGRDVHYRIGRRRDSLHSFQGGPWQPARRPMVWP